MKKSVLLFATIATFAILFLNSCKKNAEPDPTSPTTTDPRTKFDFTWLNSENSVDFGPATYNVSISDSSDASYIMLSFLYGFNKRTYATVSGNNFTIPTQVVMGNNVSGTGVLTTANQINIAYLVQTTLTHFDTISAVLTK